MWKLIWILVAVQVAACGGDETTNNASMTHCSGSMMPNPITGECVRTVEGLDQDLPTVDMGTTTPADMGDSPDVVPDGPATNNGGCTTDSDRDGALAPACGGDDCDDADDRAFPGATELCDEVDNNCDGQKNEGLTCKVYAHSSDRVYRLDFFAGTYEDVGPGPGGAELYDLDTAPDGTLYGIAGSYLYRFDDVSGTWTAAPQAITQLSSPNGFCIDNDGTAYVTDSGLFQSTMLRVDLTTGASTQVGLLSPAISSGDCVVSKGNILYMTSSHTTPDSFVRIDGSNAQTTVIGRTQHDEIWGLTAAYNRMFGMTSGGDVVEIDVAAATTRVVAHYDLSFYGAASTPSR